MAKKGARTQWVDFTRRTNDPKLAYIEHRLDKMEIPGTCFTSRSARSASTTSHRRNGKSFHAPILQVPQKQLDDDPMFDDFVEEKAEG